MFASPARAQSVEEFYRGRSVTILVGFTAGGGYDLYARLLGRHIGRYIPGNPTIVVQNMPGAGSMKATQFVYGVAAKDGLTLATVSRGMVTEPLLNAAKLRSDQTHLARHHHQRDERLRHLEDLAGENLGRHVQARVQPRRQRGRRRSGHLRADPAQRVRRQGQARHRLSGRQRHQPRHGAPGGRRPLRLVVDQPKSQKNWLPQINVLVQFNLEKNADLPDVPVALERAANDEQRQVLRLLIAGQYVGRPFFTSPDIPADRKAALRSAFDATMKDPQFLADAAKLDLEISPISARADRRVPRGSLPHAQGRGGQGRGGDPEVTTGLWPHPSRRGLRPLLRVRPIRAASS